DTKHERVVQRLDLMNHAGADMEDLALPECDLVAGHEQLEGSLQDVRHLLALMRVLWHNRASPEIDLREGLTVARDEFAGNHLGHFFEREFVPAIQSIRRGLKSHVSSWSELAAIIASADDV